MAVRECPTCKARFSDEDWDFCPKDSMKLQTVLEIASPSDKNYGRLIANRFILEDCLGSGGMGKVYRARHRDLERYFALKFLHSAWASSEKARLCFEREAKTASTVEHPNVVRIYDYGHTDEGELFLAMEFVDGPTLHLVRVASPQGKLPPDRALDITLQVCRALEHAHSKGVIHRDIKPENIILSCRDNHIDWVKLVDFGLAKIAGEAGITLPHDQPKGTPQFMAPEMWQSQEAGPEVDLYAIGVLLHDLLVGTPPFSGAPVSLLVQHLRQDAPLLSQRDPELQIPSGLDHLVKQLLHKDPKQRPTAAATVAALEQVQALLPRRSERWRLEIQRAQTLLLPRPGASPAGRPLPERPTAALPATPGIGPVRIAGFQAPAMAPIPPLTAAQPTLLLYEAVTRIMPRLSQIDQLEAGRSRAESSLEDELEALQSRWPQGWTLEAKELRRQLNVHKAELDRLSVEQALCEGEIASTRRKQMATAAAARLASLQLSQRLQNSAALNHQQLQALRAQLLEHDQQLAALLDEGPVVTQLQRKRDHLQQQFEVARVRRDEVLLRLTRLLLKAPCPKEFLPKRQRIAELMREMDNAAALLTQLMSGS